MKMNSSVSFFTSYSLPGVKTLFTKYFSAFAWLQTTVRVAGAVVQSLKLTVFHTPFKLKNRPA